MSKTVGQQWPLSAPFLFAISLACNRLASLFVGIKKWQSAIGQHSLG